MGGGDLNLKKSWHPQTLRNVEKVWKAEQKAEAEAKKIEQLRRELDEEREREEMQKYAIEQGIARKKSDRLEWMYSAPGHAGVNREEYLLGKAIDKAVDPLAANGEKNADAPGASFMDSDALSAGADLAAKIRDDPLFMIKKKENEKKKELLKNPVRMKQLQQMLRADLGDTSGKKGKKEKKKRKKEKRKRCSSDDNKSIKDRKRSSQNEKNRSKDSDSSEDSDRQINGFSKNGDTKHHQRYSQGKHEPRRSSSSEGEENYKTSRRQRTKDSINHSRNRYYKRKSSSSRSPSPKRQRQRDERNRSGYCRDHSERTSHDRYDGQSSSGRSRRSRSRSPITSSRTSRKEKNRSYSPVVRKTTQRESGVTRKMTDEERERKLAEMMDNAKWRDEQRGKNVKRYKKEEEEEAEEMAKYKEKGAGASFVQPMKVQTFTSSTATVENRIKRNINSLQRTPAALENFLKK